MRLSLERIDSRTLHLDLGRDERLVIAEAEGLRGELETAGDTLKLSGVAAERLVLAALRVLLGELVLSSASGAALSGVRAALTRGEGSLELDAESDVLDARTLAIDIGDVHLDGAAKLSGVRLSVRDGEGSLVATRVELAGFTLRIGDLALTTPALMGDTVTIAWGGEAGFRLTADAMAAPSLGVALEGIALEAQDLTVTAASLGREDRRRAGERPRGLGDDRATSSGDAHADAKERPGRAGRTRRASHGSTWTH